MHFMHLKKSTIVFRFFLIFFRQTFIKQTPIRHAIKKQAGVVEKSGGIAVMGVIRFSPCTLWGVCYTSQVEQIIEHGS